MYEDRREITHNKLYVEKYYEWVFSYAEWKLAIRLTLIDIMRQIECKKLSH